MNVIYFDGGCKPNPGKMEAAIVSIDGQIMHHQRLGHGTNNEAEWMAFLWACETALMIYGDDVPVTIRGDSNLVIQQALGNWRCKHDALIPFFHHWKGLNAKFLKLEYIPRDKNLAGQYIEELN